MKRTKFYLAILLLTSLMLFSCNSNQPNFSYSCYEIGGYDCLDGGIHADEYPSLSYELMNYHQNETAPNTLTVTFNGETFIGEYQYSYITESRMYISHKYKANGAHFEINAESGELCAWTAINPDRPDATISAEKCRPIADSIAKDYISLNDYKVRERLITDDGNFYAKYTYYKEIDGLPTSDSMIVSIDGNGCLSSVRILNLGSADYTQTKTINQEAAMTAVNAKLDNIYTELDSTITHDIRLTNVTVLDDGNIAIFYTVEVNNADTSSHSVINIMVIQSESK